MQPGMTTIMAIAQVPQVVCWTGRIEEMVPARCMDERELARQESMGMQSTRRGFEEIRGLNTLLEIIRLQRLCGATAGDLGLSAISLYA